MVAFFDFHENAVPIQLHQLFRIVLPREGKALIQFNMDILPRKKLFFYLFFHRIDKFLLYQTLTSEIYTQ